MDLVFATAAAANKRHMQEIGLAIAAVGGLAVILSGAFGLRSMSRMIERATMIVAGVLLTVGFVIQLYGLHSSGK
jgi:hypothetical protein